MYNDYLPKRWDSAISTLGKQFCIPKAKVDRVISSVRAMRMEDNDRNYRRAWSMLMDLI